MTQEQAPSFEKEVRPLFRSEDVEAMSFIFDLAAYEDVRANAEAIYDRLADGSMPCDEAWAAESVALMRRWIDTGMQR